MSSSDFAEYVVELLAPLGAVTARRMFGGFGIYCSGVMFGLIADDTLYLKVDATNQPGFEAADMDAFTYTGKGKPVRMSYFEAPPDAMEDTTEMLPWARGALDAALRGKKPGKKKPR